MEQNDVKELPLPPGKTFTYKPLKDLKYSYYSRSQSSTVEAQISWPSTSTNKNNQLGRLTKHQGRRMSRPRHFDGSGGCRNLYTGKRRHTNTVNDTYKMKLLLGQIHDEISLIELHQQTDSANYGNAFAKHRHFVQSFQHFLTLRYERVSSARSQLENEEHESSRSKERLRMVRRQIAEKSSIIYQLHEKWVSYRVSQRFIVHISKALRRSSLKKPYNEDENEQNIDKQQNQQAELVYDYTLLHDYDVVNTSTLHLDELTANFEKLAFEATTPTPFSAVNYGHVTAASVAQFLAELKEQNFNVLRFKLQSHKFSNTIDKVRANMEAEFYYKFNELKQDECEIQRLVKQEYEKLRLERKRFDDASVAVATPMAIKKLPLVLVQVQDEFVRKLYQRCFNLPHHYVEKSSCRPMAMVKYVEDYCQYLLCELYSFEQYILKRVSKHLKK